MESCLAIAFIDGPYQQGEDSHEVDMADRFSQEYRTEVVLMGELAEDGSRRAPHRETEIDGIAEIDRKGQCVDDDKHPSA